jgi:hypothetical protein
MVQKIDLKAYADQEQGLDRGGTRLKLARGCLGGSIHYVAIRRLRQKDAGHNWKVADIVPRRLGAAW